jgi:uncharacterized protein (TIGR02391 family)
VPTLLQLVPDVETLLNIDPEDLGIEMLRVFDDPLNTTNGMVNLGGFETAIFNQGYPVDRREEILEAVREAFAWLEGQALLISADPMNAGGGWKKIGRRGRRLVAQSGGAEYRTASLLPRQLLHPRIKDRVYVNFQRGDYSAAVAIAFIEVETAVRDASKIEGKVGADLMRAAFNPTSGPLTDLQAEPGEREGRSHLFAGAFQTCRNPHGHHTIKVPVADAVHMLMLASYLLRIVDTAAPTPSS